MGKPLLIPGLQSGLLPKKLQAFDKFIQSKTADMLFDEKLSFWWNGPDYLADEYEKEMAHYETLV